MAVSNVLLAPPSEGDHDRSPTIVGFTITVMSLATICVTLRMVTRKFLSKNVGWDDWTIVLALVGTIIGAGLTFTEVHYGFGRHRYYLSEYRYREFEKFAYLDWLQTILTLMITKVSIALLLLRIAASKRLVRPLQVLIGIMLVSHVILALLWTFQCLPIDAIWDLNKTGKCFDKGQIEMILMAQGVLSCGSDFLLAAFPILLLRKVLITLRVKAALCALMGLGVLTGTAALVRTILNYQNVAEDITWCGIVNFMWRLFEVNLGIACACIPTLLPLYRYLLGIPSSYQKPSSGEGSPNFNQLFHQMEDGGPVSAPNWVHKSGGTDTSVSIPLPLQNFESMSSQGGGSMDSENKLGKLDEEGGGGGRSWHVEDRV